MKNICFLIGDINNSGGTERVATLIANKLEQESHKIFLLSLSKGDKPFFELSKSIHLASLFKEKVSMKTHFLGCVKKIRNFLIKNKIDTLIVVDSISCIFTVPACLGLKVNHICWEHFGYNISLGSKFRVFGRRLASIFCSHIVTLTNLDKNIWISKISIRSNILTIPNPCPFAIVEKIDDKKKNKIILAVGRLSYEKGFDLLLNAWEIVCKNHPDWMLHIVGTGSEEQKLLTQSEKLKINNNVIFHGLKSDLAPFYEKSSIFCLPSRVEGFGLALLEAQNFGTPVVAFDCEIGPRELIKHHKNGILCKENDVISLSNGLIEMIASEDDVYNCYVNNSLEFSKKFSIDNIINQWKKII